MQGGHQKQAILYKEGIALFNQSLFPLVSFVSFA